LEEKRQNVRPLRRRWSGRARPPSANRSVAWRTTCPVFP